MRDFQQVFCNQAHFEGSQEFGQLWHKATEEAIAALEAADFDAAEPETVGIISIVLLAALRATHMEASNDHSND